jgi:hypothetical protein
MLPCKRANHQVCWAIPKKPTHTELNCSPDGPWVTIRDDENNALTINYREHIREIMPAERSRSRRRIMARWLKARTPRARLPRSPRRMCHPAHALGRG